MQYPEWIWHNGTIKPWAEATTHVMAHALHYGSSVFEGIRAYRTPDGTAIFRLADHNRRLYASAKIHEIDIPYDLDTLNEATREVLRRNRLDSAYIRPVAFRGLGGFGLSAETPVDMAIGAWPWGAYLGAENMERGIRIKTSSFNRHHPNAATLRAKANGNYINSMMALNEVLKDGYDEALTLDTQGYIAEGSAENIFLVIRGELHTPDLTACLDGITRRTIIQLAQDNGLKVIERRITRDEVYVADEAFFTGTAAEVTPIREVDGRKIGAGRRGPVTEKLQKAYFDLVTGKTSAHAEWRTLVK